MSRLITQTELVATLFSAQEQHADARGETPRTLLVGIDGLGGSGKTTLAHEIVTALKAQGLRAETISIDDFSHRNTPAWDDALFAAR